jgi:HSP20 family protein
VDRKVLTVRAQRKRAERDGVQYVVTERPMGPVSRQVFLSDSLDTDRLDARYDNGVLTLSIPVTEKAKPRKFEVAAA